MCSNSMSSMKGICPICNKVGYLILEKPRAKNVVPYTPFYRRNKKTQDYSDKYRKPRSYYRFSHTNSNPCYMGCLETALTKEEDKEYFNKNYIPNPKDSMYILNIIREARKV